MAGNDGLLEPGSMVPSSLYNHVRILLRVRATVYIWTYNLDFFLGPGLPRGLGVPLDSDAICPRLLLLPAPGFFRFLEPSSLGTSLFGAGVELDSDALSWLSGAFTVGWSSTTGAGEEADDVADGSSVLVAGSSKRRSSWGDSLSTTILPCFLPLSGRADGERPGVLDDEMAIVIVRNCGVVVGGRRGGRDLW